MLDTLMKAKSQATSAVVLDGTNSISVSSTVPLESSQIQQTRSKTLRDLHKIEEDIDKLVELQKEENKKVNCTCSKF